MVTGENTCKAILSQDRMTNDGTIIGKESSNSLEEGRRGYALSKVTTLSSELQEISVAKFEVDHLPERREVGLCRCFTMCLSLWGVVFTAMLCSNTAVEYPATS